VGNDLVNATDPSGRILLPVIAVAGVVAVVLILATPEIANAPGPVDPPQDAITLQQMRENFILGSAVVGAPAAGRIIGRSILGPRCFVAGTLVHMSSVEKPDDSVPHSLDIDGYATPLIVGCGIALVTGVAVKRRRSGRLLARDTVAILGGQFLGKSEGVSDENTGGTDETVSHCRSSAATRRARSYGVAVGLGLSLLLSILLLSVSRSDPRPHFVDAAVDTPRLIPIETIQVGERVLLDENPVEPFDDSFGTVDSATWRKITLRESGKNGVSEVVLLRPASWIAARVDNAGKTIHISVPEVGIVDKADVVAIEACPEIEAGAGAVVIGAFSHPEAPILDLHVEGLLEPIRATPNHPFWSIDRMEFIEAQALHPGERLRGWAGRAITVVDVQQRHELAHVFNLEIQGQHVYRVSPSGVLVHNASHRKGKKKSTKQRHEEGQKRQNMDRGGEKADPGRTPPRKRPKGWRGPWPPPN